MSGFSRRKSGVLLALAELIAFVGVPGTRLADDPLLYAEVDQAAFPADSGTVNDIEFRVTEWRCAVVDDYVLCDQVVQVRRLHIKGAGAPGGQDLANPENQS